MEFEKFYTVNEVAQLTGRTKYTVRRWIRSGKLKAWKKSSHHGYVIRKANFDEFIREYYIDREKSKENRKEYRTKYFKEYYQHNKDKILKKNREWYKNNRERSKEIATEWRRKNRDRINTKRREAYKLKKEA